MESKETGHHHTPEEERRIREAALDKTIADSFPASDPPSSNPNPDDHSAVQQPHPSDADPEWPNRLGRNANPDGTGDSGPPIADS